MKKLLENLYIVKMLKIYNSIHTVTGNHIVGNGMLHNRFRAVLLLLVALFFYTQAGAQVTAGFTASPTSGCAPLLVNFTNTTSPAAGTSYVWTFGSLSTSTLTNPSTSFTVPGVHVVTLVATNGAATSTYTLSVTVHPQPTVNFVADDTTVCPGAPVTFTSTTIAGVPGAVTYTWAFGDGFTGTGSPVSHSYAATGSYMVTLFAVNATGCNSSHSKPAYVDVMPRPVASFSWSPLGICNPPGSITFTSTSTGTAPLSYAWTFGDGGFGSGSPASHSYSAIGSYNPKLIVTDGNGCKDSVTLGPVRVDTIRVSFTGPDTACVNTLVSFTNTSSPHTSRTWTYGGPASTTGLHGSASWSAPGIYTVTLNASNPPCTGTFTKVIVILPGPSTDFTISPVDACPAPVTVTYTPTPATAGVSYSWILTGAGGGTGSGSPYIHTWSSNGVKVVRMIEVNTLTGCRDTVTKSHTIYDLDLSSSATPDRGCVPLTVTFATAPTTTVPVPGPYPYPVASYSWDFGDGSAPVTTGAPVHTYTAVGIYIATVTVTTSNGCTVTDTVRVIVGRPPEVTFTATPRHVCYGTRTTIMFDPEIVVGPVDEYHWSFGDGGTIRYDTTSGGIPVGHIYDLPGTFTVTVTPWWRGCEGIPFVRPDYITIDSPKAIIGMTIPCSPGNRVFFIDSSLGATSRLWMFGDGDTSSLANPVHDYAGPGTYVVRLATYNSRSNCHDTAVRSVYIDMPTVSFSTATPVVCFPGTATFSITVTGGTATSYRWFIDGVFVSTVSPVYTHTFGSTPDTGYNTVRLIYANSRGCPDTITRTNYVYVSRSMISFTTPTVTGCRPLTSTFTSTSTHTSGASIVSYLWRFFDGSPAATGTPVTHTFTTAGTYDVRLIVTDSHGCQDSLTRFGLINVVEPRASFTASTVNACVGVPVTFTNTTTGVASASWNFGDGGTSTLISPVHTYNAPGIYNVRLSIVDVNGCTHDTTYMAYMNVTKPDAAFRMSDSVSVCPPLTVTFTNTSIGAASSVWTFGDGGGSTLASPSNMYIAAGLYDVRLIVTNAFGCKDTADNVVNIFGYAGAFSYTPTQGCAPLAVHFSASLTNIPFITWDFSDGVTSTVSYTDTITHIYTTPGAYVPKLLLSDNTGCQASSIGLDTIRVDAINPKMGTNPSPVCIGVPFSFIDSSTSFWSPVDSWTWTYDGNTSTDQSPTHTIYTPGTYSVTLSVSNAWGCTGNLTGEIVINPPPNVTASGDTTVCVGDPAMLYGYGAVTYEWSPATNLSCTACNPTAATPTIPSTYMVTGYDANGCIDTAFVTVYLRTHTISRAWGDTAVCQGISVPLWDTGGTSYLWLPPTGLSANNISNPIARPPYTVVYTVVATLAGCIPDTNTVTLLIHPTPTVDAGPDQRLLAGTPAQINATGSNIAIYSWSPTEWLSCADCPNPVASPSVSSTFYVDVTSSYGCRASDSVRILYYCDNSMVFIPNAFTPNGDGNNDMFYPRGQGISVIKTFRIYNRWGELMYERGNFGLNEEDKGWDGSFKGAAPKPDVYVYIIEATCFTGEDVNIKGDVTIIR